MRHIPSARLGRDLQCYPSFESDAFRWVPLVERRIVDSMNTVMFIEKHF